jgi:hypothetical protein
LKIAQPLLDSIDQPLWIGKNVFNILAGIGVFFAAGMLVIFTITGRLTTVTSQPEQPSLLLSVSLGLLESIALLGGVYLFGLRPKKLTWQVILNQPLHEPWGWITVFAGLIVVLLSGYIATLIQLLLGLSMDNPQLDFLAPQGFSWLAFGAILLTGGILAPLAEEVFFRGVLFRYFGWLWGFWPAALASSFFFGLLHRDIAIGGAAFLMGILLAWIYAQSRSLWPAIIIHIMNNSLKIILLYILLAKGF